MDLFLELIFYSNKMTIMQDIPDQEKSVESRFFLNVCYTYANKINKITTELDIYT